MRLFPALAALVFLGAAVSTAEVHGQPPEDSAKILVTKFPHDLQPTRWDVVVFKYPEAAGRAASPNYVKPLAGRPGETIVGDDGTVLRIPSWVTERITVEGGTVEVSGDVIKIKGGKVEIIRQPRQ
ncbi:MAG TPA: S26 family signal peptidase [Pirellulaceae bacterium]|nr:S26 family signal peptidase [Pirellulaceae bacterium]